MQSKIRDVIKREWDPVILIGLTLVALASRSYGISKWHFVGDEYYTVYFAAERFWSLVNPAYYGLVLGSLY